MGNRKKGKRKITVASDSMAVFYVLEICLTAAGNGGEISIIKKRVY